MIGKKGGKNVGDAQIKPKSYGPYIPSVTQNRFYVRKSGTKDFRITLLTNSILSL